MTQGHPTAHNPILIVKAGIASHPSLSPILGYYTMATPGYRLGVDVGG
jgi:hypothetical protein